MTSAVGRIVVDVLTNQSGGAVAYGDPVYIDTAHDTSFTTGTTSGYTGMVGVCIEPNGIASAASGRIQISGRCPQVNLNASGTRGHFIKTHTVAKQATDAGASRVVGAFGQLLTTGSTPVVELFGFPDGSTGAAGSPGTPALTLGTANSTGAASTLIATDATIAAFDATAPSTQASADAAAAGSAGVAARRDHKHAMPTFPDPWYIYIDPLVTAHSHLNWATYSVDTAAIGNATRQSDGAQNDYVTWDFNVGVAGTWTFAMMHRKHTVSGIYHVQIDGVDVGTIDGYNAGGAAPNSLDTVTGISISAGKHTLKLLMSTKNASASSYFGQIQKIALLRTA